MNVDEKLSICYEILMVAARSGFLNARGVRTGYTHWLGPELSRDIQLFSGYVSKSAIGHGSNVGLVLEHFLRIQTELTSLMERHMKDGENLKEFISEVRRLEQVHIVTKQENDLLRRKEVAGNYHKAGIELVHWNDIQEESRMFLRKKLRGKVSNANQFI